jgi:hypothetical protein
VYHLRWSTVLRCVLSYTIIALFLSDISKKNWGANKGLVSTQ